MQDKHQYIYKKRARDAVMSLKSSKSWAQERNLPMSLAVSRLKVSRETRLRGLSISAVLALILLWYIVTTQQWIDELFLPSPQMIWARLQDLISGGYMGIALSEHILASLGRMLVALFAAVIIAIPLGLCMGQSRRVSAVMDPFIEFYRPIPPLAYLPLIVIWCGIGELSKVLLIFLAIFAPVVIATATGVRTVDPAKIRAAQSLGATRIQIVRHVVIPSALPQMLTGIRIGLGVGWSTLVAAELVGASEGLGFMVQSSSQLLATDVVFIGIFIIALIACALELGLRYLQKRWVPWQS